MKKSLTILSCCILACIFPAHVFAGIGVGLAFGGADDNRTDMLQIKINKSFDNRQGNEFRIMKIYWEAGLAYWFAERGRSSQNLYALSGGPVLRLQSPPLFKNELGVFLDGGVGVHLLSRKSISGTSFSTHYQFGPHIGTGLIYGNEQYVEMAFRFEHLSNANIKKPNYQINFVVLRLGYVF